MKRCTYFLSLWPSENILPSKLARGKLGGKNERRGCRADTKQLVVYPLYEVAVSIAGKLLIYGLLNSLIRTVVNAEVQAAERNSLHPEVQ